MKKLFIMFITALLVFASCNNENIPVEVKGNYGSITASIENGSTKSRLAVQTDNSLEWSEGDVIKIILNNGDSYRYRNIGNDTFNYIDQPIPDNTSNEDVVGVLFEGCDDVSGSVANNRLETALAQNVTWESSLDNKICLPMWGTWTDGHISFKHLAGILRVNLSNLPAGYDMLSLIASNPIVGTAIVEDITVDSPVLALNEYGEKLANIRFEKTTENSKDKTLYIPLPVGTYSSIKVLVSKYDENLPEGEFSEPLTLANWKNKTVERATIYTGSIAYTEVTNIDDLNTALATNVTENNMNAHIVINEISGEDNQVEVPEVVNSNVTLDFSTTSANTSLQILSGTGESVASSQNIAVNVGNETSDAIDLELNTPKATVQLGTGKFATLTATTATNTLIINGGVKIERLVILGGNVLIEAGVRIGQIENSGNGTINYIVRTEEGLMKAFEDGGKYQVYDDIKITNTSGVKVGNGKSVVLDLNNKTITAEGDAFVAEAGGILTLNGNGFVKAGNTVGNWVAVWANGGTVTINDGKYSVGLDTNDSNSCVYVKNGGQVTINGGEFSHEIPTSGNNFGMPLQVNNDDTQGKIIVNAGVFVLDNGRYYEAQDLAGGKIIINAGETVDNGKVIVSGAFGNTIIIENTELSDALYKLYGDVYYIIINSNGYAEMRESEVLSITSLNFDPYEYEYQGRITTLDGIEHFVNLQYLDCRNYGLTSCDVSQNTALIQFAVQGTQNLTSLDFSNNPNIQALYLNGNNGLTSMNLTGCNQLSNLQLFGSALTSLDIPNKAAMTNLLFGGSLKLDPKDYPNLTGLGCENLELTDLNTFIPDNIKSQLHTLFCGDNELESLDLSKFSNLGTLWCGNNNIEELDLSHVPNLYSFQCYGNKIKVLDISNNEGLNDLMCSWQQLDENMILQLTPNQKTILVDNNAYFNPSEENVTLEIVVVNESELKSAVEAGYNVKLGAGFAISSAVVVDKTLTIDMNGKTLTSAGDGFEVTAGTLTIKGNGTMNAGTKGDSWVAVWANGGNAVIENGTFSVVEGKDDSTNDCIYAKGGTITINGGTFSNNGTYYPSMGGVVINANNTVANSKVVINGGTFNPATGCVVYEQADIDAGRIVLNNN